MSQHLLQVIVLCLALAAGKPSFAQLQMSEVQVVATPSSKRTQGLRARMPQPQLFFLKGDTAPSCGLRVTARSPVVLPMLQAASGENFPACEAVTHAQTFVLSEGNAYVYRFRQRDTREDVSTGHFFVLQRAQQSALEPLTELNDADVPIGLDIAAVGTWAKAKLQSKADAAAGFAPEWKHNIVAGAVFMNVARSSKKNSCRTVLGQRDMKTVLMAMDSACRSVVATSRLVARGSAWWLTILETADGARQLHVLKQTGSVLQRMPELETQLAPLATNGLAPVKAALRAGLR